MNWIPQDLITSVSTAISSWKSLPLGLSLKQLQKNLIENPT
jgi:hypothetical protein